MKKILPLFLALALATPPLIAGEYTSNVRYTARPEPAPAGGLYVAIFGGLNVHQTADVKDTSDGGAFGDFDLESDTGWFAGVKFGYELPVRSVVKPVFEVEGFYNGVETRFANDGTDVSAELHSGVVMVNALLKFECGKFRPYLGGGLGYAHVWFDQLEVNDQEVDGADTDEGVFAYQGIAGLEYRVTERVGVFAEYKALVMHDLESVENYVNHLVGVGVRLGF